MNHHRVTQGSSTPVGVDTGLSANDTSNAGCPSIGLIAAAWLIDRDIVQVGADTWQLEVAPNPLPGNAFHVHHELPTKNGMFIFLNLATEMLIEAGVSEAAYTFSTLMVKGATGSPGVPQAFY